MTAVFGLFHLIKLVNNPTLDSMDMLLFGFLGAIAIVVVLWLQNGKTRSLKAQDKSSTTLVGYRKKDALLSPAERSFYGVLKQVVGDIYQIQSKVRLGDILAPQQGLSKSDQQSALNRINQKHIDFVLLNPKTTEIVLAIELDDSSHAREDRHQRDNFVNSAMQSAGLALIHFAVKDAYSVQEVRSRLGLSIIPQPAGPALQPLEVHSKNHFIEIRN